MVCAWKKKKDPDAALHRLGKVRDSLLLGGGGTCGKKKLTHLCVTQLFHNIMRFCERVGDVGGWGRDPKKCTGRDWGMGSSTI